MGPDFVCIGAPKAGTGWLFDQLSWHPEIWMPPAKELRYLKVAKPEKRPRLRRLQRLLTAGKYQKANRIRHEEILRPVEERDLEFINRFLAEEKRTLQRYAGLFEMKGSQISGDITPFYSVLEKKRIDQLLHKFPDLKVIYLVREPVARAWSHIQMHKRQSVRRKRLADFNIENLREVRKYIGRRDMIFRSSPTRVVDRWLSVVPKEQFHIALFDDIVTDPAATLIGLLEFLGVSPDPTEGMLSPAFNRKETHEKYRKTPEVAQYLDELFHEEVARSAARFGGAASHWVSG